MSAPANAVPQTEAELTDEWISGVLGKPVQITGREGVGVGSAFACRLFRLSLSGPEGTPASVIAKLPVDGEVRAMLDGIGAYTREVVFYRDLADQVPVRTPIAYSTGQASDSTDFEIVM